MKIINEGRESAITLLGEDLWEEILCRLGCVKSATQCKSVCKLWRSLVNTDPHSHWSRRWCQMNHNIQSFTLITQCREATGTTMTTDYCGKETLNLDFLPCFNGKNPVLVLGSDKDLLLCCPNYSDRSCYYICNPLTKQCTALPPPTPLWRSQATEAESRYNDVRTQVEFIVDDRAQKFTLVRIFPLFASRDEKVQVSIFSSDGGWRKMEDEDGGWGEMFGAERLCKKIVSYKGRLVLLTSRVFPWESVRLYSWDLDSNHTRLLPTPSHPTNAGMSTIGIGVCEGYLRIVQLLHDYKKLIVWQFDDSQRQDWDIVQELELSGLAKSVDEREKRFGVVTHVMAFHPHDGDMLYMDVNLIPNDGEEWWSYIFTCDLKRIRVERTRKLPTNVLSAELFPLGMRCWPTPVPRLQP